MHIYLYWHLSYRHTWNCWYLLILKTSVVRNYPIIIELYMVLQKNNLMAKVMYMTGTNIPYNIPLTWLSTKESCEIRTLEWKVLMSLKIFLDILKIFNLLYHFLLAKFLQKVVYSVSQKGPILFQSDLNQILWSAKVNRYTRIWRNPLRVISSWPFIHIYLIKFLTNHSACTLLTFGKMTKKW